jgi:hypothetical protein
LSLVDVTTEASRDEGRLLIGDVVLEAKDAA